MIDRVLGQPAVWQFFGSEISGPELKKTSDGLDVVSTAGGCAGGRCNQVLAC